MALAALGGPPMTIPTPKLADVWAEMAGSINTPKPMAKIAAIRSTLSLPDTKH
jgi:hypothetical protein